MIILGIDPGTAITGYGVIEVKNNSVAWRDCGIIETEPRAPLPERLATIHSAIEQRLAKYNPERVAIEQAFYAKNVHTTLMLGHARGVLMLAAQKSGAHIAEYSPREIKKAVTGNGSAEKSQVEYMVRMLLSPPADAMPSDAYDALAAALCDFYHAGARSIVSGAGTTRRQDAGVRT
ncbi:MAG: crossover junction endodeoxyribonuclease RuvC [Chitinispirillaceae bacterium]|nr:crossover junction endodeoxyribonuclease RuvC [Chitinispirillaceae bacterium]